MNLTPRMSRPTALQNVRTLGSAVIIPILLIAVWDSAVRFGWWPQTLIATPFEVLQDFFTLALSGQLIEHVLVSLGRLLSGFLLGTVLGVVVGSIIGLSKVAQRLLVQAQIGS